MKRFVYADNAATTQLDKDAFEEMKPYLLEEYGNASQPYSFSRKAKLGLKEARKTIASCLNASPEEIFFTSGGTESDNWALKGVSSYDKTRAIITSEIEHHAILNTSAAIEKMGCPVVYLAPTEEGVITTDVLKALISSNTKLVSVMSANNEVGTIQPIKELCDVAHKYGALFHTDAVQSVGHIKIDVKHLGIDMLSASAHKFNGPKGIGFLYIKNGTQINPYMSGGSQESGLRAGTENVASIVGMATALKKNIEQISFNTTYIKELEHQLLTKLRKIKGIDYKKNGGENTIPGNISLSFRGQDGEMLLHRLDLRGICVSTGSACDSVNTHTSHVLQAINLDKSYINGTIRISLGKHNTIEDVDYIVEEIKKIICISA